MHVKFKDGELSNGNTNEADAGWGREILAPAAGTVVYSRSEVPEPAFGKGPDDNYYRPLHDPIDAYAGNCVIIDHGNSEYSVMMHMQTGSVTVKVGDQVATGQVIGQLGSSGSTADHTCTINCNLARGFGSISRCRSGFKTSMLPFTAVSISSPNRLAISSS